MAHAWRLSCETALLLLLATGGSVVAQAPSDQPDRAALRTVLHDYRQALLGTTDDVLARSLRTDWARTPSDALLDCTPGLDARPCFVGDDLLLGVPCASFGRTSLPCFDRKAARAMRRAVVDRLRGLLDVGAAQPQLAGDSALAAALVHLAALDGDAVTPDVVLARCGARSAAGAAAGAAAPASWCLLLDAYERLQRADTGLALERVREALAAGSPATRCAWAALPRAPAPGERHEPRAPGGDSAGACDPFTVPAWHLSAPRWAGAYNERLVEHLHRHMQLWLLEVLSEATGEVWGPWHAREKVVPLGLADGWSRKPDGHSFAGTVRNATTPSPVAPRPSGSPPCGSGHSRPSHCIGERWVIRLETGAPAASFVPERAAELTTAAGPAAFASAPARADESMSELGMQTLTGNAVVLRFPRATESRRVLVATVTDSALLAARAGDWARYQWSAAELPLPPMTNVSGDGAGAVLASAVRQPTRALVDSTLRVWTTELRTHDLHTLVGAYTSNLDSGFVSLEGGPGQRARARLRTGVAACATAREECDAISDVLVATTGVGGQVSPLAAPHQLAAQAEAAGVETVLLLAPYAVTRLRRSADEELLLYWEVLQAPASADVTVEISSSNRRGIASRLSSLFGRQTDPDTTRLRFPVRSIGLAEGQGELSGTTTSGAEASVRRAFVLPISARDLAPGTIGIRLVHETADGRALRTSVPGEVQVLP